MRPSRIIKPGKRIGHLRVLSHILDGSGKGSWECECDCGRTTTRTTKSLLAAISRGSVSSCGRGCGLRKTTAHRDPIPEPENDPDNNQDIDWGTIINDYHELIDRYRAGCRHPDEDECSTPRMAASGKQERDEWSGDLTGRHVSHFTVLSQSTATQGGRRLCICECECDCGDIFTRSACEIRYAARHGRAQYCTHSCPIRLAEIAPIMVGDRIGHLTVTTAPFATGNERRCDCRCDCGAQVVRQVKHLREAARRRLDSRCSPNCPRRWEHVTSSDLDAPRTTHNASDLIGRHNDTREEEQ